MPDLMLYLLAALGSYLVGVVSVRIRSAMIHARDDDAARTHGFSRIRPVSMRRGWSFLRVTRSYARGPMRVDLYHDRDADRSILERLGLSVALETYAISFPCDAKGADATFRRAGAFSDIGREWDFVDRFPELVDIDITTKDPEGLMAALTPARIAYLSDLPDRVLQVWIHDHRVFLIMRASDFEDLMRSEQAITAAMDAFGEPTNLL